MADALSRNGAGPEGTSGAGSGAGAGGTSGGPRNLPDRRSALARIMVAGTFGHADFRGPGIEITERAPLSMVQIETGDNPAAFDAFGDAVQRALGLRISGEANRSVGGGRPRICWTGPGRWLVVEPESRDLAAYLEVALATAPGASGATITDLSHGRSSLRLGGWAMRELLMKGGAIDWRASVFRPGHSAQTLLFHIPALVDCRTRDMIDLYVARSFAENFFESLTEAAAEYGYRIG